MIEFNVNYNILVKLTDDGVSELRRQHEEFRKEFPSIAGEFVPPTKDADGWSKFLMHDLMNKFGHMMVVGGNLPFETTVRLDA